MKNEDIFNLMSDVDDIYVEELFEEFNKSAHQVKKQKNKAVRNWLIAAACFAVVILSSVSIYNNVSKDNLDLTNVGSESDDVTPMANVADGFSAVILDVNPSIQLTVNNSDNSVSEITPLNDDAKNLLKSQFSERLYSSSNLNDCISTILSSLSENDYITPTQNSMLVSVVETTTSEQSTSLQQIVVDSVNAAASELGINASIISDVVEKTEELENLASEYGISIGKANLINSIIGENSSDFERLTAISIQSLNQISEYMNISDISRSGNVAGSISSDVYNNIDMANLSFDDGLTLALSIVDTYFEICNANTEVSSQTYSDYIFSMIQTEDENGDYVWSLAATSNDSSSTEYFSYDTDNIISNSFNPKKVGDFISNLLQQIFNRK